MITGFEEETEPLTEFELRVLPTVVNILKQCIGKENAMNNGRICRLVNEDYNVYFTPAMFDANYRLKDVRLRKIIHHIRCENLIELLCSNSKGYYIGTKEECEDYMKGLRERLGSIFAVYLAIKKQYNKRFTNQLKIEYE